MKCLDCGFNNPSTATICKGCSGPLNRKVIPVRRGPTTEQEQLELSVSTADYEAKRYGLEPKQFGETSHAFIDRINQQKTPYVLAEHGRMHATREEGRKAVLTGKQAADAARTPGSDDGKGEAA